MQASRIAESVSDRLGTKLLILVLSVIAGSVDVIGFLGLGALFIAHITGNLVVLAARTAAGEHASAAHLLSVPVFIIVLFATRLLATALDRFGIATLRPLLLLQFLFLVGFLVISIEATPVDPSATVMIFSAMLGVCAMAVQNVLVQISLKEAPSTAVMTTNLTRFAADLVEVWLGSDAAGHAKAMARAGRTGIAIAGFAVGACLGAWCQARLGLWSLAMPTVLALAALAVTYCSDGFVQVADRTQSSMRGEAV
ncbi:YoaK family protein [Bradyrhizobium erythrophlei]|uniref:Uncharacterized membrane protein YoaK, UPF0700 family n=1 Tax=Bradyrhizobium erythrophlei TaxID=1437360 RepID=A0A1H4YYV9_9BRAD|nr:YoaK family protein [Bradyrhizobium erythrophlei]SED22897.1 Uncharacterized membrane protein YoaK, UPF0700 family [Bradyrhizobium erythrophlei]